MDPTTGVLDPSSTRAPPPDMTIANKGRTALDHVRNSVARGRRRFGRQGRLKAKVLAKKRRQAAQPQRFRDNPTVSLVVQSFNHRGNVQRIVERLRMTSAEEFIVCEDGSVDGSEREWHRLLTRPNDFVVLSNDLHEIRTYNRAVDLARGEFVVLLQDDDIPPASPDWLDTAIALFRFDPDLAVVGCWNGWHLDFDSESIGTPVGPGLSVAAEGVPIVTEAPGINAPFAYVDAVGIGPLFVRRSSFLELGGFDLGLSRPGEPGIWLDFELCLRAWTQGGRVAVFASEPFERNVGGQGTVMYGASQRKANFQRNLDLMRERYGPLVAGIQQTRTELNAKLTMRT